MGIVWGIVGCGDVTEIKSGPAFNKVANSSVKAVMCRTGEKAKNYAERHSIPVWYTDANALINDADINAVYIATPPSSHKELAMLAMAAGKAVYIEKPMAANAQQAKSIASFAQQKNIRLCVAHYRRQQPKFKKIRQLLQAKIIGDVRLVQLIYYRRLLTAEEMEVSKTAWRVQPEISGGGLFHDLAPHQLDLMLYYFGEATTAHGLSYNQAALYSAADIVSGHIHFESGVIFSGTWSFSAAPLAEKDEIVIIGSGGRIIFSAFDGNIITVETASGAEQFSFETLQHVQQPMIAEVVRYFSGEADNPCSAADGATVMEWIDAFTT